MNIKDIKDIPPFPSTIPTAPLLRLSLSKLLAHDGPEIQRLTRASEDIGFFYLDLQDSEHGLSLLHDADALFGVGEELFKLDVSEKERFDFSSRGSYFGYKGVGKGVVDRDGGADRNEFFNVLLFPALYTYIYMRALLTKVQVSKDDLLNLTPDPLPSPALLHANRPLLTTFTQSSHTIVTLILTLLNNNTLDLPSGTLPSLHRLHAPSGDQVRFIKAPPQPVDDRRTALGEHTDFGSVTVLFNRVGGLQVLPPGAGEQWVYVRPLPGHAIVNLGDAMVKFTNGLLRSNIHRVVAPPGEQGGWTRYSLVYFARPEDDVLLKRLEGSKRIPELDGDEEEINSKDWVIRRALGRRGDVKDVDFESSAGTEGVSRRVRV